MLLQGSGVPSEAWDGLRDSLDGHFVQSRAWAQFHVARGDGTLWAAGDSWSWLGVVRRRRGFSDLHLPYGPVFSDAAQCEHALRSAVDAARAEGMDMVRVEPWKAVDGALLKRHGAVPTKSIHPEHTWVVDLEQSEDELFKNLTENRRRDVRSAAKRGLTMWRSDDPADVRRFIALLGATVEHAHFNVHADGYYESLTRVLMPSGAVSLYFAGTDQGNAIAGILGFHTRRAAYYGHAGADQERSRALRAPGPLAWHMMLDAKRAGCSRFDFWGVAPADAGDDHPWAGFSRFKRGFGGFEHRSSGTWDIPLNRPKYLMYRAAKRVLG